VFFVFFSMGTCYLKQINMLYVMLYVIAESLSIYSVDRYAVRLNNLSSARLDSVKNSVASKTETL